MRLLLLGGTGEGRALAAGLHREVDLVNSLAGRVPDPTLPAGPVRVGGFGGTDGLRNWLRDNAIDVVVDATHPFAATITANAAAVCAELGLAHLVVRRPPWDTAGALEAVSDSHAAEVVAAQGYGSVFLTTGRSGTSVFCDSDAWFLIRVVTPPDPAALPRRHHLLLSRGPYRYDDEYRLMTEHGIQAVVTKNSGGAMTRAKVDAAQALGIDVVVIQRPELPPGVSVVDSVDAARAWVLSLGNGVG